MPRNMGSMSDNALKGMLRACSLVLLILMSFSGCKADEQGGTVRPGGPYVRGNNTKSDH